MASDLTPRIEKAAELLAVKPESLTKSLENNGIKNDSTGISLLEASTTSIDDITTILVSVDPKGLPSKKLQLKAAASILKGSDPFKKEEEFKLEKSDSKLYADAVVESIKMARPIEQYSDRELLERYAKDKEGSVEQELHKRAKQQNFIVLKHGKFEPGKEEIDIDLSLDLLKTARKRTNPSMISLEGKILPVYRITELNLEDRILEICPICSESLYKGYCEKCQVSFASIGDDERAYVNLISESDNFNPNSFSDKKAVIASATKGLEDLKQTWPSLAQKFDELKATSSLPRLKIVANRPSQADPFFQNGNRAFGNRVR